MCEAYWWKIKDGLFIGNQYAANDIELFEQVKATRAINCAGFAMDNYFETSAELQVEYLTYSWVDNDRQVILDEKDMVADEVFDFIEGALEEAETVFVLSVHGQSRSCCLVVAYMMRKYLWSLTKAIEFVDSRRLGHRMQNAFMQQLSQYAERLAVRSRVPLSNTWDQAGCCSGDSEELLLMNTFHNAQEGRRDPDLTARIYNWKPQRLVWSDKMSGNPALLELPDGVVMHNIDKNGQLVVRSVLKGSRGVLASSLVSTTADGSMALGLSSTATPSSFDNSSKGLTRTFSVSAPAAPAQPVVDHEPLRIIPPPGLQEKGAKVFRFLLAFEPPALAIEWGHARAVERSCTRIEFKPEDFLRNGVRMLAERVVAASPLLTIWHRRTVESLLDRLASRSLPLYRVSVSTGCTLSSQPSAGAEVGLHLPFGALVVGCERVRRSAGWWLRIWSGHWLPEGVAELCTADADDAARWLRDAARSEINVLLENARAVVQAIKINSPVDLS
jgi:hypothetical protein